MKANLPPFNIDLLIPSDQDVKNIRPVKVLDIFDGFSKQFHPDGLFSIETFGKVGEERRNRMFSYIDMKIFIFHPVICRALWDLKGLYMEIMSGKSYAVWDDEIKDFVKSTPTEGRTGYAFFVEHLHTLQFEERPSAKREFNIKLIQKYRNQCMFDKLIVLPAGMRDFTVDENNKPSEDEINKLYREVLAVSSVAQNVNSKLNAAYLDSARFNVQLKVNAIYDYIVNLLEGKSKLILGKWASRNISNSTRNVITSYIPNATELHGARTVSANQTVVGLYQYLRMIMPVYVSDTRDTYLSKVFTGPNSPAILVNKKTLKKEMVNVDPEYYDEWMTYEGLEKVAARFGQDGLRHLPLEIDDYWLGLMYKGPDGTFKFVQDKDELPEGRSAEDLKPITYAELLYISNFVKAPMTPCFVTRYPVIAYGGFYPSYVYLKSTVKSEIRKELGEDWEHTGIIAEEFPITGEPFYNSVSPNGTHIGRLGADFDGDMVSVTAVWTDDSRAEIKKLLNSKSYYVGINGKMVFSADNDVLSLMLRSMTGD